MDRRIQIAVVLLIVVAIGAALLTRPPGTGSGVGASPQPPTDLAAGAPGADPGAGEATVGDAPADAPTPDAAAADGEAAKQLPRFVEVGADSCVPCKMMQPILDELRTQYAGKLQVDFADVWKDPALGDKYQVRSIPTQVIYDADGREVFRHTGFWPKEDIDAKLKELGVVD